MFENALIENLTITGTLLFANPGIIVCFSSWAISRMSIFSPISRHYLRSRSFDLIQLHASPTDRDARQIYIENPTKLRRRPVCKLPTRQTSSGGPLIAIYSPTVMNVWQNEGILLE